jgi:uncharacterized protein (TIGR02147 family)
MINIFEYQNYRLYLSDYYNDQKKTKKYFSYRYFSNKAGINASAFLYYVIQAKRNLTKSSVFKISAAIGHNRDEADFFENLVFFNQATTIKEKTAFYNKIVELRKPVLIAEIGADRFEYYGKWYHSVVREIVTFLDFAGDYKALGEFLVPGISAAQAKESVGLLEKLGFIEKDENGLYHQTDTLISAKPVASQALLIERFQAEILELAVTSFDRFQKKERLTASTTFSISEATFDFFVLKTREFRKELMEIARLDSNPERVYQFAFNLFPLSKKKSGNEK